MSASVRTWLCHTAILVAIFVVVTVGARMLDYDSYLPLWASVPTLILLATVDYVGTVGVPGRRKNDPQRDDLDAVGPRNA
jgi:hypothetical protein